ncbi:MAG: PAS domain S-box protein [Dehalococcoidia bacterium]|nr:PAS domain S-box protein [Dehalococcoidia bacterium]
MKYRDFLEGVGAAIFAIDMEGRFIFLNEQALQLLGYGEDAGGELVGQHFSKIMAPDQTPVALDLLQRGREVRPAVLQALRRDGSPVKLEVSGAWVRQRGRRVGALAMAWEVGTATAAAPAGRARELSRLDMTILRLVSSGLSNREIAQRVYLSKHTIKDRIEKMMRSFNVHRRAELAAEAARQGLV